MVSMDLVIGELCRHSEFLRNSNIQNLERGSFEQFTNALEVRKLIRLLNFLRSELDFGSVLKKGEGNDRDKVNFFFDEGMKLLSPLKPARAEKLMEVKKMLKPQNFKILFACREYVEVESMLKERREVNEQILKSFEEKMKQILTKHSICLIGCEKDFDELNKCRYETKKEIIPGTTEKVFIPYEIEKVLIPLHYNSGPLIEQGLRQGNLGVVLYWFHAMNVPLICRSFESCDREFAYLRGCLSPEVFDCLKSFAARRIPRIEDHEHFRWSSPGSESDESLCSLFNVHWEWVWENIEESLTVTLRVYGYHEAANFGFEQRQETMVAQRMSFLGEAPGILESYETCRIEKPIDAKTLSLRDLRGGLALPVTIAKKLYQFHHLNLSVNKHICLWTRLKIWVDRVSQFADSELAKEIKLEKLGTLIDSFKDKLSSSLLGFCHNDVRVGNILREKGARKRVFLTGYELATWNPVAFDISGFFWSMTGDHETSTILKEKYPDRAFREAFVGAYLSSKGSTSTDYELNTLLQEVEDFSVVTHLYQGLWGLIYNHAKYSNAFYLTCAKIRLKWFWEKYADMQV